MGKKVFNSRLARGAIQKTKKRPSQFLSGNLWVDNLIQWKKLWSTAIWEVEHQISSEFFLQIKIWGTYGKWWKPLESVKSFFLWIKLVGHRYCQWKMMAFSCFLRQARLRSWHQASQCQYFWHLTLHSFLWKKINIGKLPFLFSSKDNLQNWFYIDSSRTNHSSCFAGTLPEPSNNWL